MTTSLAFLKEIKRRGADGDRMSYADVGKLQQKYHSKLGEKKVDTVLNFFDDLRIVAHERAKLRELLKVSDAQINSIVGRDGQALMRKHVKIVAKSLVTTRSRKHRRAMVEQVVGWSTKYTHAFNVFRPILKQPRYRRAISRMVRSGRLRGKYAINLGEAIGFEYVPALIDALKRSIKKMRIKKSGTYIMDLRVGEKVMKLSSSALTRWAADLHRNIRYYAVIAMFLKRFPKREAILFKLLSDKDLGVRGLAAQAPSQSEKKLMKVLSMLMQHPREHAMVRRCIVMGFGMSSYRAYDAKVLPALKRTMLTDPDQSVRKAARESLKLRCARLVAKPLACGVLQQKTRRIQNRP